ncbi:MAG: hypothetical protein CR997_06840 [Acidobacteria bacterium]|nr:MAG: hypothetical protein CR997_06840 [Acidobacteriota bacterium]
MRKNDIPMSIKKENQQSDALKWLLMLPPVSASSAMVKLSFVLAFDRRNFKCQPDKMCIDPLP